MCIKKLKSRQIKYSVVEEEDETEDNVNQSISAQNNNWIYYLLSDRSNFLLSLMKLIIKLLKSHLYSINCGLYLLYVCYINQ